MKRFLLGLIMALGLAAPALAADTTAPDAIADLAASAPFVAPQLHVNLAWTATGDDAAVGRATTYTLRYSTTCPLVEGGWAGATNASGIDANGNIVGVVSTPLTAGDQEFFTVVGLKPNTTYCFAIKAADEVPNTSAISNSVSITTPKYEGYGYQATGGGEATIVHVTNLNDSGAGSFRTALGTGTRYIVFDVGGTINVLTTMDVNVANLTIDGATAPSPGITLSMPLGLNDGLRWRGIDNTIFTHLRIQGIYPHSGSELNQDSLTTNPTSSSSIATNMVWDHLTIREAGDAGIDLWDRVTDASVLHCFMLWNFHPMTTGGDAPSARESIHHNLWAYDGERMPQLVNVHTDVEIRNNLYYKWFNTYAIRIRNNTPGPHDVDANIVGNYFYAGTSHPDAALVYGSVAGIDAEERQFGGCPAQGFVQSSLMGQLWVANNVLPAQNCDQYSTVAAERTVAAGAEVTTDSPYELETTVLTDVGMQYKRSDEAAFIAEVLAAVHPPTNPGTCE